MWGFVRSNRFRRIALTVALHPGTRVVREKGSFDACSQTSGSVVGSLCPELPTPRAIAGPNSGGVLILHAPSVTCSDGASCCGASGISSCSSAIVSLPADPGVNKVITALAAFPSNSSPRLSVVTFGLEYDQEKLALTAHGHCGMSELTTDDWPNPGSGTAVEWDSARTDSLAQIYWFAGYRAPRALGGMPMET